MDHQITIVTPAHARDFDRFCLQRESIERCGIALPHVALVNTEDMALFQGNPFKENLTLVPTCDVLPRSFERRRHVWLISRRDWRYWTTGKGVHGWMVQQLLKLAAPSVVKTGAFVCVDTDTFFVDHVTDGDFFAADGRLHLYETTDDVDVEMAEWYAHALRFFGVKETGLPVRRYTHSPVPMHREIVLDIQRFAEEKHGRFWMDVLVDGDRLMEYSLYGAFAREVDKLRRVAPAKPPLSTSFWWPDEVSRLEQDFSVKVWDARVRIVGIQSNTSCPVSRYRPLAEKSWQRSQEERTRAR